MYKTYSIILSLIIWSSPLLPADNNSPFNFINEDGSPSQPFAALLQVTGIEHDGTIEDVIAKTQPWLRKEGQERCHIVDPYQDNEEKREEIFPLLEQIGVISTIGIPTKYSYDYLCIHCGLLSDMKPRFILMTYLLNNCKFKKLIFLTGERPLDPIAESEEKILAIDSWIDTDWWHSFQFLIDPDWNRQSFKMPKTEYELSLHLFNQIKKPKKWKQASVQLITTAQPHIIRTKNKEVEFVSVALNEKIKPTTVTSIKLWLESQPTLPGSCLAVSNQPFVGYQDTHARSLFPDNLTVETLGMNIKEQNIGIHVDNLARWLYAIKEKQAKITS